MMWKTTKIIEFSYGHRLLDYNGACKYPHGHNGKVEIVCANDNLDNCGMVVDFGKIKTLIKGFIDENWDHAMLLRKDDPLLASMRQRKEKVFIFDSNPTAEVMAKYLFDFAKQNNLPVIEVRFYETSTSIACYSEE